MGAVISQSQHDKVNKYIEIGSKEVGVTTNFCSKLPTDPALKKVCSEEGSLML
jgi:hypothetical protein